MNMSEMQTRIFVCPFNQGHKLMEYRKWLFHVSRCGARRGKSVYICQYQSSHYFCDITSLIQHEAECQFRKSQKTRFDNSNPEVAQSRPPSAVYCKYDVGHVFATVEDCQEHMSRHCPKKEEFMRKAEQCHRKFQQNKDWIKAAQQAKKEKEDAMGGNLNAPASKAMPNLRYQYVMNEPFIGGFDKTVCPSIEANVHKRRVAYDLDIEEERQEQAMSLAEQKNRMNRELCSKIDTDIVGRSVSSIDIDILLVKQETLVDFGLKIDERKYQKLSLFDFNIEKQMTITQFLFETNIDVSNTRSINTFIENNYLMKLNVIKDINDDLQERWRERSLEILDEHQMQLQFGEGANDFKCVMYNSTQGRKLNCGIKDKNSIVHLYLITKETEYFGKSLKSTFKCDFILLKYEQPQLFEIKEEDGLLAQKSNYNHIAYKHILLLRNEKLALDNETQLLNKELLILTHDLETTNKSIWDKERNQKQNKRELEYKENQIRRIRLKTQEANEQLRLKEVDVKNSQKEIDNLQSEVYKHELRFDQQKQRTDNFQNKFNESTINLQKAQDFLGQANKIVRHKTKLLQQSESRVVELEKIFSEHFQGVRVGEIKENQVLGKEFVLKGKHVEVKPKDKWVEMPKKRTRETAEESTVMEDASSGSDVSDAEILDDDDEDSPDFDRIQKLKAEFQLKQLNRKQDQTSEIQEAQIDIQNETLEKLKERLLCVSCLDKPKCMVIQNCKHVPFCQSCEEQWRQIGLRTEQPLRCPICRSEYKKAQMIQIW